MVEKKNNIYHITFKKYEIQEQKKIQNDCDDKINWNIFDKIYCIHYLPYKERLEPIKEELKKVGILDLQQFEFYYTINNPYYKFLLLKDNSKFINDVLKINWDYDNSTYNTNVDLCFLNQSNINLTVDSYNLLNICKAKKYRNVLFLEDDIKFLKDLHIIKDVFENFPKEFDVVNCSPYIVGNSSKLVSFNNFFNIYKDIPIYNMSCVALSYNAICQIIEKQKQVLKPFDHYTWKNAGNLNTYSIKELICIQDASYSNRQNSYMRTNKNSNIDRAKYDD